MAMDALLVAAACRADRGADLQPLLRHEPAEGGDDLRVVEPHLGHALPRPLLRDLGVRQVHLALGGGDLDARHLHLGLLGPDRRLRGLVRRSGVVPVLRRDEPLAVELAEPVGLPPVVGEHRLGARQERLLVQEVGPGRLEVGPRDLEARLRGRDRRARLVEGGLRLGRLDLDEERARRHELAPLGVDRPDVPRGLGEDGGLPVRVHVAREGEGHLERAALRLDDAHLDLAALARDGPGLLLPQAEGDERRHQADEGQQDQRHAMAPDEFHPTGSPWCCFRDAGGSRGDRSPRLAGRASRPACRRHG